MSPEEAGLASTDRGPTPRWVYALLLATVLVGTCPLLMGQVAYLDDTSAQNYGMRAFAWHSLRDGDVPTWFPAIFHGIALLGEGQSGVLYPGNLIGLLMPNPWLAYNLCLAMAYIIVAFGAFALARELGLSPVSALAVAGVWAFGGPMISHHPHIMVVQAASLTPWIVWGSLQVARATRPAAWIALLAALVGCQILAYFPQVWLFTALLTSWVLLWRYCGTGAGAGEGIRMACRLGAAGVLGLLMGAVQLLPALEFVRNGSLEHLAPDWAVGRPWPLRVLPWAFTLPAMMGTWAHKAWYGHFCETAVFSGVIATGLALAAVGLLWRCPGRCRAVLSWLLLVILGVMAGSRYASPLARAAGHIPFLQAVRFYTRFALVFVPGVGVLAGLGLDALRASVRERQIRALLILACGFTVASALAWPRLAGLAAQSDLWCRLLDSGKLLNNGHWAWEQRAALWGQVWSPRSAFFWEAATPAILAVLAAWLVRPATRLAGVLAVLVVAEMAWFALAHMPTKPSTWWREPWPEVEVMLRDGPAGRACTRDTWYDETNGWAAWGISQSGGHCAYALRPMFLYDFRQAAYRQAPAVCWEALSGLGVAYVAGVPDEAPLVGGAWTARAGDRWWVERSPDAAEPAWFATTCDVARRRDGAQHRAVQLLAAGVPRPIVVEAARKAPCSTGRAWVLAREASTQLSLATESRGPGLVFVSETWYPGWQASVDGRPTDLLRLNGYFRGVVVPAGKHLVTMTYQPRLLLWGAVLSAFACLVVLLLAGAAPGTRRCD
jgi:hypothetical protein